MASRSRPARAVALEIGNDLHSSVKIHDPACQQRIRAATVNVMIAEMRAAIFRNVAILAVIPRPGKRSIRPPDPTVNDHVTKWAHCEHCESFSQVCIAAVFWYRRCGATTTTMNKIRFA